MAFLGNLTNASQGAGFQANAPQQPVTPEQAQAALAQQQAFVNALQGQNGIQNQSNIYNQLGNVASGQGPNPAQAMLANTTGANVANQAALMAGQRGSGANAGLIARQAAQQGGALQQQAAGQAAQLQAQQSLAAMGQQANIAGQQVANQSANQQALNQNLMAQLQAQQTNQLKAQQINAGIAEQNQKAQAGILGGLLSGAGAVAGTLIAPGVGTVAGGALGKSLGDLLSSSGAPDQNTGAGSPLLADSTRQQGPTMQASAHGGMIKGYAEGGEVHIHGPKSIVGKHLKQALSVGRKAPAVPTTQTPLPMKSGAMVPGKANVKGDNLKNDTVPAMLSPGEIVIPRSVVNSQDPIGNSAKFVQAVLAKHGMKSKKKAD